MFDSLISLKPLMCCNYILQTHINDKDNRGHGPRELMVEKPRTTTEANDVEKPKGVCAPVHRLVMPRLPLA